MIFHHAALVRLDVGAKTPEQESQFLQFFLPTAGPLCNQDSDVDSPLDGSCDFIENTQVITAEHGENDRLPSGAQKLKDGIATCRGCDYKPVYSLTYLLT